MTTVVPRVRPGTGASANLGLPEAYELKSGRLRSHGDMNNLIDVEAELCKAA
jgi:hypothetical protein